jgi:dTDP-glucose 4,6-dehydratase
MARSNQPNYSDTYTGKSMSAYQPHSMLVTGGAGFIGSNFIRHVLTCDPAISVINLDKLTYAGSLDNLQHLPHPERHHFIQGDICDAALVRHILQHHHIDTIVHFAAESHVDRSITSPQSFVETNVLGTFTLLEAARHHWFEIENKPRELCRFHHISTDEVFGSLQPTDPAFTEETTYQPRSPYSASKAGSDHLVHAYHHTYGLPITLSNCSNNYGPYQHTEKFIPTIIRACLSSKPIPVYGKGNNIRDWLYVDDHCSAIMAILKQGKVGETYNIGGNSEWENLALVNYICELIDDEIPQQQRCASLISFVTDRAGHDFRYAINDTKIRSQLNWQPKETLATGLKKTIEFYMRPSSLRGY